MMLRSRWLRVVIVVAVLAGIGYWAFRPRPVAADFGTVTSGPLEVTIEEEGRTRVRDRYVLSAPLPGRMQRIQLDPGDPVVARKTLLAEFHPADPMLLDVRARSELEARVRAAEASLGVARSHLDRVKTDAGFARSELQRAEKLMQDRVISARELESAQRPVESLDRELQSAQFGVRAAEHQVEVARASLLQTRGGAGRAIPLYSPVDGVVLRLVAESEAVVPAGQPLLEVGNVDDLEIVSDLLSSAAVAVKAGQDVRVEQWGGEQPLHGRVRRIEPSGFTKISALGVEEQRVNAIVDITDPREQWRGLGDGYRVEIRVIVWKKDHVLKVPTSSLFRHEGKWALYRVENGTAFLQVVEIGQRNGLEAEVLGGIAAGAQILVYPSESVGDGVKVTPRS